MAERQQFPLGGEGQQFDRKSLRMVMGKTADFVELAKDCVCFANGPGGQILIGVEAEASPQIFPSISVNS